MRVINGYFHSPKRKLRNRARHMRNLRRWHSNIEAQIPDAEALTGRTEWHFKISTYAALVESRDTTDQIRRACINEVFRAAEAVENSPKRPPNSRVGCLISTPDLFSSEVTIFLTEEYFEGCLPVDASFHMGPVLVSPVNNSVLAPIRPQEPAGLRFYGGTRFYEFDEDDPQFDRDTACWIWAYPRR